MKSPWPASILALVAALVAASPLIDARALQRPSFTFQLVVDGALIGAVRFKDAAMTLYEEGSRQFEYSVLAGELVDSPSRPNIMPREQRRFVEQIDVDGGRGYWPVDFTWRETTSPDRLAFDVIGRRQR